MGIVQCANGHFYDSRKYTSCPFCGQNSDESLTVRLSDDVIERDPIKITWEEKKRYAAEFDNEKTIRYFSKEKGNDFVTGWIVCVQGPEKGQAYTLHSGFNRVGRSPGMDVFIEEDRQISRSSHCAVVYEYNKNEFFLVPEGGNLVYLNDEFLGGAVKLETGDVFKIGGSEFEFVAFCRGDRKWKK